jgi:hypothetical protein
LLSLISPTQFRVIGKDLMDLGVQVISLVRLYLFVKITLDLIFFFYQSCCFLSSYVNTSATVKGSVW